MSATERRAQAILSRLPEGPILGAEVGVFMGRLSRLLLQRPRLTLHMIDSWLPTSKQPKRYVDSGDSVAKMSGAAMRSAKQKALALTEFAINRRVVYEMDSVEAGNRSYFLYDFVFIDADHSEEGCARDLRAWRGKVRSGGLLCGHDYGNKDFPGVKAAVDAFMADQGLTIELGEDNTYFARVP